MVFKHTRGGAQVPQSHYWTVVLTRATGGAHRSQYPKAADLCRSRIFLPNSLGLKRTVVVRRKNFE